MRAGEAGPGRRGGCCWFRGPHATGSPPMEERASRVRGRLGDVAVMRAARFSVVQRRRGDGGWLRSVVETGGGNGSWRLRSGHGRARHVSWRRAGLTDAPCSLDRTSLSSGLEWAIPCRPTGLEWLRQSPRRGLRRWRGMGGSTLSAITCTTRR